VMDLLRRYLDRQGFSDIEIRQLSGLLPARTALDAEIVQASEAAARIAHGQAPVIYPILPGSGPMHALCRGIPAVLAGVGHANARYHAPNENIFEQDYFEGIHFVAELIRGFAT
jgi:acetylornithine deacetylase/succinyl-diaminopimelate desuccinylase-like protein